MELETLENLESFANFVLIRPNEFSFKKDGYDIEIDTSYRNEPFAVTSGTVVSVPHEITFGKKSENSAPWKTKQELEVGDTVYYYYLSFVNAMSTTESRKVRYNGEVLILVKYESIYAFKREDLIKPINGYVLVKPIPKNDYDLRFKFNAKENEESLAEVLYVGDRLLDYKVYYGPDPDVEIKRGDIILMDKGCDTPLQYQGTESLDGDKVIYRLQRKNIICKIENHGV